MGKAFFWVRTEKKSDPWQGLGLSGRPDEAEKKDIKKDENNTQRHLAGNHLDGFSGLFMTIVMKDSRRNFGTKRLFQSRTQAPALGSRLFQVFNIEA